MSNFCQDCGNQGVIYVAGGLYCALCALQVQQANPKSKIRRSVSWRLKRWHRVRTQTGTWRWLYIAERTAFASVWILAILAVAGVGSLSRRFATSLIMVGFYLVLRAVNDRNGATTSQKISRGVRLWLLLLAGIVLVALILALLMSA